MRVLYLCTLVAVLATTAFAPVLAQGGYDPTQQSAFLQYQEARTVYLGNLVRRENGAPPLRWNRPLTYAARWFSWDSTENRPSGFCGHQDSLGGWPGDRARRFGYLGNAGAENAFCGYVTPEYAIWGWMNSEGHRANLLDPNHREVGLGYYRRESDGRGYVTQDFGSDPVYAPVIIENEAISTTSHTVNLYIHDRGRGGGFAGLGPAVQMMLAEDPCFSGAAWETYRPERTWTFGGGFGWRTIYVRTRDAFSRTLTVSDTIYLGTDVPLGELDAGAAPPPQSQVTLYSLDNGPFPYVQFSLGWLADDTFETFNKWWGNGERVSDPSAWGGTAYRLYPGNGESFAWVWDTAFPVRDVPLVAYFRLKVNDNTSTAEVARISVKGGDREYGPRSLRGTDFTTPNQYQEFAISFTFHPTEWDPFLIFQFWRSGTADLYVDAVSIFTAPQPVTSPLIWTVPGGNYRGQGIWARYTDGTRFSAITEVSPQRPHLAVSPASLAFLVRRDGPPQTLPVRVTPVCGSFSWQATADRSWMRLRAEGNVLWVEVDPTGLPIGVYTGTVTVAAAGQPEVLPVSLPVRLAVAEEVFGVYLPLIRK